MMMQLYKYLFYRIYEWNLKIWGKKDMPQWNAMFGVSFMMFLNLSIIALFLQLLFKIQLLNDYIILKEKIVLIMLSLFVINYFIFIDKQQYIIITKQFIKESPKRKIRNTFLLWVYVVFSFVLFALEARLIGILSGH